MRPLALALVTLVSCFTEPIPSPTLPIRANDVTYVMLVPVPEGPSSPVFGEGPRSGLPEHPIRLIRRFIPDPLPAPIPQDCDIGSNVVLGFDGGRVDYGPCERPRGIERLREAVICIGDANLHTGRWWQKRCARFAT